MKKFLLSMCCVLGLLSANAKQVTDVIDVNLMKTSSAYTSGNATYKDVTVTGASGASYIVNCYSTQTAYIQIRGTSPSGIVNTTAPGTLVSVSVSYHSSTAAARILNVYDNASTPLALADIWNNSAKYVGQMKMNDASSQTYNFTGEPAYFGTRVSASGAVYLNSLTVVWEIEDGTQTTAMPVISCENNEVTITAEEGATIYYTLDNTTPTTSSEVYSAPFPITATTTVKAIAVLNDVASDVRTYTATYVATYAGIEEFVGQDENTQGTITGPITVVYQSGQYLYVVDKNNYPGLLFGNNTTTYANGDQFDKISGTLTFYNSLPEIASYTVGNVTKGATTVNPTVVTAAEAKDEEINSYLEFKGVTISALSGRNGSLTDASGSLPLYTQNFCDYPTDVTPKYTVRGFLAVFNTTIQLYPTEFTEYVAADQVATPTFDPESGMIPEGSTITIECETEGATIYYTVDGTEPTTSSEVYSEPLTINVDTTVKAFAVKEGMTESNIATAVYTVADPNATEGTFNFDDPETLSTPIGTEAIDEKNGYNLNGMTFTSNAVSISFTNGSNTSNAPRLWISSGAVDFRMYVNNSFTISVPNGFYITAINFTKAGGSFYMSANTGNFTYSGSEGSWVPSEGPTPNTITFTSTQSTSRVSTISVIYDNTTTGVESVVSDDANAPVEFFNLQGVRVDNPAAGQLVIRRQGNTVTKVLVK